MTKQLSLLDEQHIKSISAITNEPQWLRRYRQDSLATYDKMPLETSPLYSKYTDAAKMNPQSISVSNDTDNSQPAILTKRLKDLETESYALQTGTQVQVRLTDDMISKGVTVLPISEAIAQHPDTLQQALKSSSSSEDRFTALNNAAFNTGVFIHIPNNTVLSDPIHIVTALTDDGISVISRNVISAGENSKSKVVQEMYGGNADQAYLELLNCMMRQGAHADITTLQMMGEKSYNFSTRRTEMSRDSTVNWYLGLFGSQLCRYRIAYHLNGIGASANDSEVVFGNGSQSFDIQAGVVHNHPSTEGRITEKSILRDKSRSLFKGMIRINPEATKSSSYLSGRSILLGRDAKSDAIPGLEILTNDVKATHSASVAQIDEEQIFYLMSRCLSRKGAERTIVEGFLEPLSRRMSTQIRAWIAHLIESKWEGRSLTINTDEELRKFVEVEETRYNENAEIEQHYKYRR